MPRRKVILIKDQIYHVFNRSIARETIFTYKRNLSKALEIADYYQIPQRLRLSKFKSLNRDLKDNYLLEMKSQDPLIEIYAFAFMPNHYHFLLKQLQENGIKKFIANFQNSFAKIHNLKNQRDGGLFQNAFKAIRVETDEQFIHLSRYIHLNPVTNYLIEFKDLQTYPWTSFPEYSSIKSGGFVVTEPILKMFKSPKDYSQFVKDQVSYQRDLATIKRLTLKKS